MYVSGTRQGLKPRVRGIGKGNRSASLVQARLRINLEACYWWYLLCFGSGRVVLSVFGTGLHTFGCWCWRSESNCRLCEHTNMSSITYDKLYTLSPHTLGTCQLENTRIAYESHLRARICGAMHEDQKISGSTAIFLIIIYSYANSKLQCRERT